MLAVVDVKDWKSALTFGRRPIWKKGGLRLPTKVHHTFVVRNALIEARM